MPDFEQWVHLKITDKGLADKLDAMVAEDMRDRSKFVRWLIQQEYVRRHPTEAHWVGKEKASSISLDELTEQDGKKLLKVVKVQR